MKSFYQYMISAPLYVLGVLLVCFGSCQSSDNTKVGEGASVASLPLTAQIGEASSRVGMSDTYGGAFRCYWNSDKLSVYHPYVLSGAVQNMTPLEFGTPATNGTSAAFSYTGSDAYRYNPGSRLYAFSKGTGGGYAASVENDGTSTLTASTLASQNGTLSDCAKYDALYGSAGVDYNTGKPISLTMHHLYGMLNLHLTNSNFSTRNPVTVTLTSSATNILPDNGGSATFNADGSLNQLTGSWGTNWSATVTPTTAGVVDVYMMTWPFSATNGTLTVSCSDASYFYTPLTVTISSFSLAAAQIKSKQLAIANTPPDATYSKLYAWDATDYQPATINIVPTNANTIRGSGIGGNQASYACKNCPSYNEITWYLSAQYYWDDGKQASNGGNATSYSCADGSATKAGMWFRKQSKITGFSSTTFFSGTRITTFVALSGMTSTQISALKLSTDYFFLPLVGDMGEATGFRFSGRGAEACYWSSTPSNDTSTAYYLILCNFSTPNAYLYVGGRNYGSCLWKAQ